MTPGQAISSLFGPAPYLDVGQYFFTAPFRATVTAYTLAADGIMYLYAWESLETDSATGADVASLTPRFGTVVPVSSPAIAVPNQLLTPPFSCWMRFRGIVQGQPWFEFLPPPVAGGIIEGDTIFEGDVTFDSTSVIVMAGPTWNITVSTTTTVTDSQTWELTGGPTSVYLISIPTFNISSPTVSFTSVTNVTFNGIFNICGYWRICIGTAVPVTANRITPTDGKPIVPLNPLTSGKVAGIFPQAIGQPEKRLFTNTGGFPQTFLNESSLESTPEYRVRTPNAQPYTLEPGETVPAYYDTTLQRWRLVGTPYSPYAYLCKWGVD